jgi:hypothetical protein
LIEPTEIQRSSLRSVLSTTGKASAAEHGLVAHAVRQSGDHKVRLARRHFLEGLLATQSARFS